jgi:hypothetical protein
MEREFGMINRLLKRLPLYLLIIADSMFPACDSDPCLHGSGDNTVIRAETGYFKRVKILGIFNVTLVQDSVSYLEFEGGDKMLEQASFNNEEEVLSLTNSNRCSFLQDYQKIEAFVHFTKLEGIDLMEVCKVESQGRLDSLSSMTVQGAMAEVNIVLNTQGFRFYNNHTTGGLYTFYGSCDRVSISGYYTAKFNTEELSAREVYINNSSLSDFYITASEILTVEIHNKGNIYYRGSPAIVIDSVSGSGQLLPWVEK